jgi:hypothetical protein
MPIKSAPITNPELHSRVLHAKDDNDLIKIMKDYIASVGGWGNAPKEVFARLNF